MIYEFGNDVLKCKISSVGAELVSVLHEGRERLWQNETGGWAGHAPILFPHGGKCAIQVNGKLCSFQLHGIVMKREFSLVENTGDTITLCLHANEETKALYPFDFSLFITYMVVGNCLQVIYKAVNNGTETMPAAFCCHESYALDGEIEEYEVEFENEERFLSPYAKQNDGRLTGEVEDFGFGKICVFDRAFMRDNSVILVDIHSRSVLLKKRATQKVEAKVTFPDFPHLLFWQPPDSRMLCIEPWQNMPDDLHAEPQEFSQKAGVTLVKAGGTLVSKHQIEYF